MQITLKRINDAFHLEAANESGNTVNIDASPAIGGEGKGARPMELLLMGLGGCSAIDVLNILKKARQPVADLQVTVNAERQQNIEPALFTTIHAHYVITGNVAPERAQQAVDLSLLKYCSVARIIEQTATITWSFEVRGEINPS
jgi:putative redox protein